MVELAKRWLVVAIVVAAVAPLQGCLVVSLHPAYDGDWIDWDPGLVGTWRDADDHVTVKFDTAEWRSYRVHYDHPSEHGDLTGYLTLIGNQHYLDVTAQRGVDYGSFLLPLHVIARVDLVGDSLTLTPLSYDWFDAALEAHRPVPGLAAVFDQKQNALIVSPTARLRAWLRGLPSASGAWGAPVEFSRVKP